MMQVRRKDLPIPGVQHQGKGGLVSPLQARSQGDHAGREFDAAFPAKPVEDRELGHETPRTLSRKEWIVESIASGSRSGLRMRRFAPCALDDPRPVSGNAPANNGAAHVRGDVDRRVPQHGILPSS